MERKAPAVNRRPSFETPAEKGYTGFTFIRPSMLDKKKSFAALRIVFGFVWLIDAYFKWQPSFTGQFVDYVTGALSGQPGPVQVWINLWIQLIGVNPTFFAYAVAVTETAIALGLIFGFYSRVVSYAGIVFSLVIWSTAEGFGGPYIAGSTDIGGAIIYALVFVSLLLGDSGAEWSLDKLLMTKPVKKKPVRKS
jgi:uncharacterized membrane protein YphA (DoxX/SURF4 family)